MSSMYDYVKDATSEVLDNATGRVPAQVKEVFTPPPPPPRLIMGFSGVAAAVTTASTCVAPHMSISCLGVRLRQWEWTALFTVLNAAFNHFMPMGHDPTPGYAVQIAGHVIGFIYYALFLPKHGGVWPMITSWMARRRYEDEGARKNASGRFTFQIRTSGDHQDERSREDGQFDPVYVRPERFHGIANIRGNCWAEGQRFDRF